MLQPCGASELTGAGILSSPMLACALFRAFSSVSRASAQAPGGVTFGGGAMTRRRDATAAPAVSAPAAPTSERDARCADRRRRTRARRATEKEWAEREREAERGVDAHRRRRSPPHAARAGRRGRAVPRRLHDGVLLGGLPLLDASSRAATRGTPAASLQSDSADHIGGRLTLSMQVAKWLETYLATSALANSNPANRPALLQVLGDSTLGAKAHGALSKIFHVGGAFELWLVNGTGSVGLDGAGTSAKFRGLATADLRGRREAHPAPLQHEPHVRRSTTRARSSPRPRRRAARRSRASSASASTSTASITSTSTSAPRSSPPRRRCGRSSSTTILIPVNRQDYRCRPNNPSSDKCLATDPFAPSSAHARQPLLPVEEGLQSPRGARHRRLRRRASSSKRCVRRRRGCSISAPAGRSTRRTARRSSRSASSTAIVRAAPGAEDPRLRPRGGARPRASPARSSRGTTIPS